MNFAGEAVKISLQQATDQMLKEGSGAETAALNLKSAEAVAKGYNESAQSIRDLLEIQGVPLSVQATLPTQGDADLLKLQREYATLQGPLNFEAEMNTLRANTIKNYFTVLQATDALKINQDNLAVQERIYKNTVKKYDLGVVSKQEVLQAEIAVLSAKDAVAGAITGLNMAKMGLNTFLGYEVMQKLELTDTLKAVPVSTVPLGEAIAKALTNRNEIKAAGFALRIQEILMNRTKVRYPFNSSTYLKQQVALQNAQFGLSQALSGIEIDVRSKYMTMMQMQDAITKGTASAAKAKELLRLAELSYSVGMNTVTDVQQVQVMALGEQLSLSQDILDYNLAVDAYNTAMNAGIFKSPL
jgi:outer membrane protein TolC